MSSKILSIVRDFKYACRVPGTNNFSAIGSNQIIDMGSLCGTFLKRITPEAAKTVILRKCRFDFAIRVATANAGNRPVQTGRITAFFYRREMPSLVGLSGVAAEGLIDKLVRDGQLVPICIGRAYVSQSGCNTGDNVCVVGQDEGGHIVRDYEQYFIENMGVGVFIAPNTNTGVASATHTLSVEVEYEVKSVARTLFDALANAYSVVSGLIEKRG